MRVSIVAPLVTPLRPAQAGGAQAVLCDLALGLSARGDDVEVVASRGSRVAGLPLRCLAVGPFPEALHRFGGRDRPDEANGWPPAQAPAYLALAAQLAARPDRRRRVVHHHALDWPAFYSGAAGGGPTVHTLHLGPVDRAAVAAASAAAACRPRPRFVAVSRSCAAQWRGLIPVDAVVPNGVDAAGIRVSLRPQEGLAVVAGRISPEKGTHLALAAIRLAGLRALVAGAAYDRDYFDERVVPELERGAASWVGPLSRRRLIPLLRRATVVVMASVWEEPFGMVALEANMAGTPVAALARGALPEVIGRSGGTLTHDPSPAGLSAAIGEALRCDRAGVRRAAERRFSLARMVEGYRRVYRGALEVAG